MNERLSCSIVYPLALRALSRLSFARFVNALHAFSNINFVTNRVMAHIYAFHLAARSAGENGSGAQTLVRSSLKCVRLNKNALIKLTAMENVHSFRFQFVLHTANIIQCRRAHRVEIMPTNRRTEKQQPCSPGNNIRSTHFDVQLSCDAFASQPSAIG